MESAQVKALIAAGPGSLRDSLRAMLVSLSPGIVILEADDTATAKQLLNEYHPQLVIIDSKVPGNHSMELVAAARAQWPRVRSCILVDTISQQAAAMKAGADQAPFLGIPPVHLFSDVERLLQPQ